MTRRHRVILSKRLVKRICCLVFALVIAVICALPMTGFAENDSETEAETNPEPVSAEIRFYKTTIGGGSFGSKIFSFRVVRVADKFGAPWTGDNDTVISNNGIVTVEAGANQADVPAVFTIGNLTASDPDGQAYYYKVSEIEDPDSNWDYDDREFVVRVQVFEIDGTFVVPRQGQEWFHKGVSYDKKGGGDPRPPNEYNTFINEYTGAGVPLGRLSVKKEDFNETPAYPDEVFEFLVSDDEGPLKLSAPGITIRKVSGKGTYEGTDLENGKFTLTYDTQVQIAGLPVGEYTITESVVGYKINYTVSGKPEATGSTAIVTVEEGKETSVVFSNDEIDESTSLTIKKVLTGEYQSWGVGDETFYRARVIDARGRYLTFSGTAPDYTFTGTSASGSEIRFSVDQPAVIRNIPIGTTVTVQEIIPAGAFYEVSYTGNGNEILGGDNIEVVVTNYFDPDDHGVGNITISKRLAGGYKDWGVDENTVFTARVKDLTDPNNVYYLDFERLPDGNYAAVAVGTGNPFVQFTASSPVLLTMLWSDEIYEVEEVRGANYTTTYTGNNARLPEGGNMNVTVLNAYEHGSESLVISKKLAGSPGDWGVDENTVFQVRVKDVDHGNYVTFELLEDGRYLAAGNNNSGTPTDDPRELIRLTAGSPVIVSGLWIDTFYEVEEVGGAHYAISYLGNNTKLPQGGNMNVTVTNTYVSGVGNLVVKKALNGLPGDWGVNENTAFSFRVKDVTDDNYLLFALQKDGTYLAIANNGSRTPTNDARELVKVTSSRPVAMSGLWSNHDYVVEEVAGPGYTTVYQGEESMSPRAFPKGGNINVTITNTYNRGSDDGRLVIEKAKFIRTPAKPHEAFTFVVTRNNSPADLSAEGIHIRKTGGSGEYIAVDLKNGRFTLTYDTQVTIDGLPLGTYDVSERVSGYITSYKVTDNSVTRPSDGAIITNITYVFTNVEIGEDPSVPPVDNRPYIPGEPESGPPEPGTPRSGDDGPGEDPPEDAPLVPDDPEVDPGTDVDDPNSPAGGRDPNQLPRTGDGTADRAVFPLLPIVMVGVVVLSYIRHRGERKKVFVNPSGNRPS